jgi:hypothetical protein
MAAINVRTFAGILMYNEAGAAGTRGAPHRWEEVFNI